ncbi:MAG: hypothetical protein JOY54_12495 [Acidobacteriaceae bacterium]|nr:hypothetical protein [Acidobacteriaceae bacterium]
MNIFEMLDTLEAGILALRSERQELAATLETVRQQLSVQQRSKPQKRAKKRARKSRLVTNSRANSRTASERTVRQPQPEDQPKPAPKTRQALGRTLAQIRRPVPVYPRVDSGAPSDTQDSKT